MEYVLRLTGDQHAMLRAHLFPGDGMEAAALILCGRHNGLDRHVFTANRVVLIPHDQCVRTAVGVNWPTQFADPLLAAAMKRRMAIMKIHSHPGGLADFSGVDDKSDASFSRAVWDLLEDDLPHVSAVMLGEMDGYRIFGRVLGRGQMIAPVDLVSVAGDDLDLWHVEADQSRLPEFARRHGQAFGVGTVARLRRMIIAIVGCSGTGSPLIEQLVRLGVGRIILIDMDHMEWRNVGRIYFSTAADANLERLKVDMLAEAIGRVGLGTEVIRLAMDIATPKAVRAVASADLVFGGLDSMAGRDMVNRIATFYNLPYIDMGVRLQALPGGGIDQITGAVHYIQPGRSSLKSRGMYSGEDVMAELLKRNDPDEYNRRRKEGYIRGIQEDRPAVISVNTMVAAMAANEMLARIHRYRYEPNNQFALQQFALHEGVNFKTAETDLSRCEILAPEVGLGDVKPLLKRADLSERSAAA